MGDELRVEPETLHASASHIDVTADDLRAQHGLVHGQITAAQAGWIGVSARSVDGEGRAMGGRKRH